MQHKKSTARYIERRRLSIYTALQKEGRIDLERFFLVENFQRRGERNALRRVELREREREIFFLGEKKATFSERPSVFFFTDLSLCAHRT